MGLRKSIGEAGKLRVDSIKQISLMPFQLENTIILCLSFGSTKYLRQSSLSVRDISVT